MILIISSISFLKVFNDEPEWHAKSKIDSHNEDLVNQILRQPKPEVCCHSILPM